MTDIHERARRQDRLQRAEAAFDPLPFDVECARAYGRVFASVRSAGRQSRRRVADLLIAATALAQALPVITRNADDFVGLKAWSRWSRSDLARSRTTARRPPGGR